jgi:Fic family protein
VHNRVGCDIIEYPGQYRDGFVGTFGSILYADPGDVQAKIATLIEFVHHTLKGLLTANNENRIYAICLGAYFLSEFLLIHPFFDGNGRTARLLLNHLVRAHTVVPLSLYAQKSPGPVGNTYQSRSAYLTALEAEGRTTIPWAVLEFVLKCAVMTCHNSIYPLTDCQSASSMSVYSSK